MLHLRVSSAWSPLYASSLELSSLDLWSLGFCTCFQGERTMGGMTLVVNASTTSLTNNANDNVSGRVNTRRYRLGAKETKE